MYRIFKKYIRNLTFFRVCGGVGSNEKVGGPILVLPRGRLLPLKRGGGGAPYHVTYHLKGDLMVNHKRKLPYLLNLSQSTYKQHKHICPKKI